ncbi:transcriptional regulator, TetR family [Abditibacterium utsteinense]|uniref:Transcriptional regulator, TetR family n=1 Tax=Abditibacterium utsteinense TaxID=1960156 RepID=A0A2S8SQ46_9BACT|nr:TetR/AcrR family transcriptional regulator [Abditibacterium utsteinense]PQV62923.1 transcriptional regulator, TetR family [Abditibacterium utsteinense]
MSDEKKGARGRPPAMAAVSHDAIIDATYRLLQEKPMRAVTIEEIARRAGVGKPTIYKWWPSKAALVIDMFEERIFEKPSDSVSESAEEAIRAQVGTLIRQLEGFFGKVTAEIIAECQSDPELMREYLERYKSHRRAFAVETVERARQSGEFKREIESHLLIDMIFGPIYYRFLFKHQPLNQQFGRELVDQIMVHLKS